MLWKAQCWLIIFKALGALGCPWWAVFLPLYLKLAIFAYRSAAWYLMVGIDAYLMRTNPNYPINQHLRAFANKLGGR